MSSLELKEYTRYLEVLEMITENYIATVIGLIDLLIIALIMLSVPGLLYLGYVTMRDEPWKF